VKKYLVLFILTGLSLSVETVAETTDDARRLMTFFTTSTERNKLDELRKQGKYNKKSGSRTSGVSILREPLKVELKGVMIREKGKPVVWVNNGNTLKSNQIDQQIRVKNKNIKKEQLKVSVKVSEKHLNLKPGQQWSESDNKVSDKYQAK
jgi:hypothetical protein